MRPRQRELAAARGGMTRELVRVDARLGGAAPHRAVHRVDGGLRLAGRGQADCLLVHHGDAQVALRDGLVRVASLRALEALRVVCDPSRLHAPDPRNLEEQLLLQLPREVVAPLPHGTHPRLIPVDRPLAAQVQRLLVAKRVGDDVVLLELRSRHEERQVADHHVEVAVPPVTVAVEVLAEDGAEGRLVLGDQPRPLVKHEAKRLDHDCGVANGQVESLPQLHAEQH
mmetsp:Transcript_44481/g.144382  ORF Transcript_44481/g.144382 Transcript_44481/m.144382 type:complete len:227 (-) Transcript_44481:581-1261(-)